MWKFAEKDDKFCKHMDQIRIKLSVAIIPHIY